MLTPKEAARLAKSDLLDAPEVRSDDAAALPVSIGPYRVVRRIASGGMGTVYEAEQQQPHRRVAIKVLRHGLASRSALRRFRHEAEVLAHLRHPGIAQIFEAGTHDDGAGGVPYFVMEYIPHALPLTRYADEQALSIRQRLALFARVCDAVHHGHQKGIIHRDLKPENILVGSEEPNGQDDARSTEDIDVKVIDFGIARATDADIALTTIHTEASTLIGTLQYMSPEQCDVGPADSAAGTPIPSRTPGGTDSTLHETRPSGSHAERTVHDLDTRSDVYSLGVILYELLTGHLPYDVGHKSLPSATRVILEVDPPPPSRFRSALRGNLDTIIQKAMAKERDRRYGSAADLGQDIRRHLAGEAIEARPPSRYVRTVRWLAGHPIATTTGACLTVIVLALAVAALASWLHLRRPHRVLVSKDRDSARLVTLSGTTIREWQSSFPQAVAVADMITPSESGRSSRLVVLGMLSEVPASLGQQLCVFDLSKSLDEPLWRSEICADELPASFVEAGHAERPFHLASAELIEVFPSVPGREIVTTFTNERSACAIRVYGLDGQVLFQAWYDGPLKEPVFLPEHSLLLLLGLDAECFWRDRGFETFDVALHPSVLLALPIALGAVTDAVITEAALDIPTMPPAWRLTILPEGGGNEFKFHTQHVEEGRAGPHLVVWISHVTEDLGAFQAIISLDGRYVGKGELLGNDYRLLLARKAAPPPDEVRLGPLPPCE